MPRNEGIRPPLVRVDIRYRGGLVVRDIDPAERRWTVNDPAFGGAEGSDFDIRSWQPAGKIS
jgi:hypothetical protein